MIRTKVLDAVERNIEGAQGKGFRRHLGASIIGQPCARKVWYTFRWHRQVRHKARLLRLFDRGNLEEARFVKYLRQAGIEVRDHDMETNQQFRIEDHDGHFGGSLDGEARDIPDLEDPEEWAVTEFKTHSDKSFKELVAKGVRKAKIEHFAQMQVYMHKRKRRVALYIAVNKNDDDWHVEIIPYEPEVGAFYLDRAKKIISAVTPPPRIDESPAFWLCRFCDFQDVCHHGAPVDHNCRSCVNSRPVEDAGWLCQLYNYPLSERDQHRGCASHTRIPND